MTFLLVLATLSMVVLALAGYGQLLKLSGEQQIFQEVEIELQQRAHQLLVQKDRIEASAGSNMSAENEQWKNALAQYMDDYEHEGRQRTRAQLPKRSENHLRYPHKSGK